MTANLIELREAAKEQRNQLAAQANELKERLIEIDDRVVILSRLLIALEEIRSITANRSFIELEELLEEAGLGQWQRREETGLCPRCGKPQAQCECLPF